MEDTTATICKTDVKVLVGFQLPIRRNGRFKQFKGGMGILFYSKELNGRQFFTPELL